MERQRITSGGAYEPIFGYCRAVRVGDHVYVAGTAPQMPEGADPPADSYGQAKRCFEIIGAALAEAGSSFEDVVRTRLYLIDAGDYDGVARAHGEIFSEIRPASTAIVVKALLDPRWRIEIEADAVLP